MNTKYMALVILIVIMGLGATLRVWRLGVDGRPLLWDEAALGYNAYSILKTGKDEYGIFMPLILKSFGDYKPALYAYAAVLPVGLFGLNEFSVKLPSAVSGVAIIGLVYLLVSELFDQKNKTIGVFAALITAINPWLIHFSRGAWEANMNLMLTLLGILTFLKGRKSSRYLIIAGLAFGLTFFTYQSAKIITPLVVVGLLVCFRKQIKWRNNPSFLTGSTIFALFLALILLFAQGTSGRLMVYNVFAYQRSVGEAVSIAAREGTTINSLQFLFFHGEWLNSTRRFLEGYFSYFSGRFLFFEGDWTNARLGSPYSGQFYWPDLLLLIIGFAFLIRRPEIPAKGFLLYWLVISPLPAALSRDVVTAVRSINFVIPLILIASLGTNSLLLFIRRRSLLLSVSLIAAITVTYLWGISYYLDSYFVHAPVTFSDQRLYGYKEAVELLNQENLENRPVFFTQKMGQPYIYVLFYNRVDPVSYQSQAKLIASPNGDVGEVHKFENYNFRNLYWPSDRGIKGTFFVGTEEELPLKDIDRKQAVAVNNIRRPDGSVVFRIVKTY
ncbi:MAG: hypothetical protein UW69_C0001G0022 [Microgenomates group bacterium GW2011_GWA2_44_7]|nr:MAG: hypothetical protein UW69_C0001G0022 [Microgenomates group bacterium GW2011_GWA2_44_7]KKT78405.1 MAG: hypothetical protein UW73_C0003G0053 [Microgenomates group bacterium GW2011_GWB1_44_8]